MALIVKCPQCGRPVEYSKDNPWRPFCSERCKLIDLGAWANNEYVIPGKPIEGNDDIDISAEDLARGKIFDKNASANSK